MVKKEGMPIITQGRRKTSIARAILTKGSGKIKINSFSFETFEPKLAKEEIKEALTIIGEPVKEVDINVKVSGGGWQSRADAIRVAICKAMAQYDKKLRTIIESYNRAFIVSDTRTREPCKPYSKSSARAKHQTSKR